MRLRMTLPHGETDSRLTYSMPDPDALAADVAGARIAIFQGLALTKGATAYPDVTMTYSQAVALLTLAEGYLDLTTYEPGQECCVDKLRDIWRSRRARAADDARKGGE